MIQKIKQSNLLLSKRTNIIIGDSKSMIGLNPLVLQHNFFNFSLPAATPIEGYLLFKNILKKNKVDTVILSFSIDHLMADYILKQAIYNHLFDKNDLRGLEQLEKNTNCYLDKNNQYLNLNERELIHEHNVLPFRSYILASFNDDLESFSSPFNNLDLNFGFHPLNTEDSSDEVSKEYPLYTDKKPIVLNQVIISYLDSISSICVKHNIKPIFIIFPTNYASKKHMLKSFYPQKFSAFKKWFSERYPEFVIYNKHEFLPNDFYFDPNHFNIRGANFFTSDFKNNFLENSLIVK